MDSRNCGLCQPCARGDYEQCEHIGRPMALEPQKYDDTLLPFLALMRAELHANTRKGDRPGWLSMKPDTLLLEIYWHTAKLSAAVKNIDIAAIREHSADVANMAMMLADVCGVLGTVHFPCVDDADNERLNQIDEAQKALSLQLARKYGATIYPCEGEVVFFRFNFHQFVGAIQAALSQSTPAPAQGLSEPVPLMKHDPIYPDEDREEQARRARYVDGWNACHAAFTSARKEA